MWSWTAKGARLAMPPKKFREIVLANQKKVATQLEVLDDAPSGLPAGVGFVHTRCTIMHLELEYAIGLFVREGAIYQVVTYTSRRSFAEVEKDLREAILSFEPE